jgi:hypothetical protein
VVTGGADVQAPVQKVRRARVALPEVRLEHHQRHGCPSIDNPNFVHMTDQEAK